MNASLNQLQFFQILHDIGLATPAVYADDKTELICKRINSFAVLQSEDEIDAGGLNKSSRYIGKRLFFSRKFYNSGQQISKLSFQYPLAAIACATSQMKGAFCESTETCTAFNFYIFDQLPGKCSDCNQHGYCQTRTWEEMKMDLANLLKKYTQAIGRYGYWEFEKDGDDIAGWYDECQIKHMIENDEITNAECVELLTSYIQNVNQPMQMDTFFEAFNDNLGMIALNFTVCFAECESMTETEKPNYDHVPFELADEGCATCP